MPIDYVIVGWFRWLQSLVFTVCFRQTGWCVCSAVSLFWSACWVPFVVARFHMFGVACLALSSFMLVFSPVFSESFWVSTELFSSPFSSMSPSHSPVSPSLHLCFTGSCVLPLCPSLHMSCGVGLEFWSYFSR